MSDEDVCPCDACHGVMYMAVRYTFNRKRHTTYRCPTCGDSRSVEEAIP